MVAILLLSSCDFNPTITPIPWPGGADQPSFDELGDGEAEEPIDSPVEDEPLPEEPFEEIEPPSCRDASGRQYCVDDTLATSGGLNVRSGPSILASVDATLDCGATVTITAMPQAVGSDGHLWAEVETSTGDSGWVAVSELDSSTPTCSFGTVGATYPGAGTNIQLTGLPFTANIYDLEFWWGFGNTTFAQENKCVWYERTSGMHPGLDFALPYNTELTWTGSESGTVVGINGEGVSLGAGPNSIVIESGGFYFLYGHTSDDESNLELGQTVRPGQVIGKSGNPGGEDGDGNDHLHMEVRPKDNRQVVVNPMTFMGEEQQGTLSEYFAGDYNEGDSPMELGYYTLNQVPECFE